MTSQPSQPQPMPAAQPVVLVVNHPTDMEMVHPGYHCFSRRPYLNRGAHFSNGCRCHLQQMIILCTLGGFFIFIGFSIVPVGVAVSTAFIVLGGVMVGMGIYFIRTAKKQFDNLPPNHPDRTKYATQNFCSGSGQSPVVYTVPPMQNQVMSDAATTGGQVYVMPLHAGSYLPTGAPVQGIPVQLSVTPGRNSPHGTYIPENDPPPAYSDVVHNVV